MNLNSTAHNMDYQTCALLAKMCSCVILDRLGYKTDRWKTTFELQPLAAQIRSQERVQPKRSCLVFPPSIWDQYSWVSSCTEKINCAVHTDTSFLVITDKSEGKAQVQAKSELLWNGEPKHSLKHSSCSGCLVVPRIANSCFSWDMEW